MVAFNVSAEFDKPEQFVVNSYMLIIFALLYLGALFSVSKGRVEWHKRLMLIGVLNLLIPAYARFCNIFNVGEIYAVLFHFIVVLVLPIAYDLYRRRRVHIGTTIGIIVSFLILGLGIVFLSPVERMVRSWYEV
jgi:NADH:ubiquinone oxidoreductase subunit 3 (subunit A)